MSLADIGLKETGGLNAPPTDRWEVAAGTPPTIEPGEPCKQGATGDEAIILLVDADLTIGTDQPFVGIAVTTSSEVAATAGFVDVYTPLMNLLYEIRELTSTLADTQTEIDDLRGGAYVMDLTSNAFTMDSAAGAGANNAFIITGGDPDRSTYHFRVRTDATVFGRAQV